MHYYRFHDIRRNDHNVSVTSQSELNIVVIDMIFHFKSWRSLINFKCSIKRNIIVKSFGDKT